MNKGKIEDNINTISVPFMPVMTHDGHKQVQPGDKIANKVQECFDKNFSSSVDFVMSEIVNDKWVWFEDTEEWVNIGNSIAFERKHRE